MNLESTNAKLLEALQRIHNNASARYWNSEGSQADIDAFNAIASTAKEAIDFATRADSLGRVNGEQVFAPHPSALPYNGE